MLRSGVVLLLVVCISSVEAADFSGIQSGLMLGTYATPRNGGMEITGIIPGYSSEGRLFPGDVLLRVTTDGKTMYRLQSTAEMETAKTAIGSNRPVAFEVRRPGVGLIYVWIEFTPVGTPAAANRTQAKPMFQVEPEKTAARETTGSNMAYLQTAERPQSVFSESEASPLRMPFVIQEESDPKAAALFVR